MTAVYPEAAYGGHPRNYPVYGPLIVMDSISRSSQVGEGGRVRRTSSLLFVDKIVDHWPPALTGSVRWGWSSWNEDQRLKIRDHGPQPEKGWLPTPV